MIDLDLWLLAKVFQPIANCVRYPAAIGKRLAPAMPAMTIFWLAAKDHFGWWEGVGILCDLSIAWGLWGAAANAAKSPNPNVARLSFSRICSAICLVSIAASSPFSTPQFAKIFLWLGTLSWFLSAYLLSCETPPPAKRRALHALPDAA